MGNISLAALGLGFAQADDGAIELALDGAHVAEQSFEAFGVGVADEEFEGTGLKNGGFVTAGALETPEAGGDFGDEFGFEDSGGSVLGKELLMEAIEVILFFAGEDDLPAGEAMFQAIHAGDGLAGAGARARRCGAGILHCCPGGEKAARTSGIS
jgi:hypothetical protein